MCLAGKKMHLLDVEIKKFCDNFQNHINHYNKAIDINPSLFTKDRKNLLKQEKSLQEVKNQFAKLSFAMQKIEQICDIYDPISQKKKQLLHVKQKFANAQKLLDKEININVSLKIMIETLDKPIKRKEVLSSIPEDGEMLTTTSQVEIYKQFIDTQKSRIKIIKNQYNILKKENSITLDFLHQVWRENGKLFLAQWKTLIDHYNSEVQRKIIYINQENESLENRFDIRKAKNLLISMQETATFFDTISTSFENLDKTVMCDNIAKQRDAFVEKTKKLSKDLCKRPGNPRKLNQIEYLEKAIETYYEKVSTHIALKCTKIQEQEFLQIEKIAKQKKLQPNIIYALNMNNLLITIYFALCFLLYKKIEKNGCLL